jgi:hypothetical protein
MKDRSEIKPGSPLRGSPVESGAGRQGGFWRDQTQPANWETKWSHMRRCTLWDAAWLSFNKGPENHFLHDWMMGNSLPPGTPVDFLDRLALLKDHFDKQGGDFIALPDLAAFALRVGWSFPDELKALARPPEPVIDSDVTAPLATERVWSLKPIPERLPGYRWPLYQFLLTAHTAGQPYPPKAQHVLDAWKLNPPNGLKVEQLGKRLELVYEIEKGTPKRATAKQIQAVIKDLLAE